MTSDQPLGEDVVDLSRATLPALLQRSTEHFSDRLFVVTDGEEFSYAQVERASRRLALWLLESGLGKGSRIGILMPNSAEWIVSWFAATRIGALVVPVNTFYKAKELGWALGHADVNCLLATPEFRGNDYRLHLEQAFEDLHGQNASSGLWLTRAPFLRSIVMWGAAHRSWVTAGPPLDFSVGESEGSGSLNRDFVDAVEESVFPADDAVIIYTSGSTGQPKTPVHSQGVVVRHSHSLANLYGLRTDDVLFNPMPFFWVGGLITGLLAVIHSGAMLVTQSAFAPNEALDLMERHRATFALGWPQQGKTLAENNRHRQRDLSAIRRTSMPAMVDPQHRPPEPGCGQLGMSEMCGNHVGIDPYIPLPESKRGTAGPSIDGIEHRIVDPATGSEVPPRVEGEIWVRGYSLMQHMYKREREETFTPDGFLRTGDGGWMDEEGWITFTGRLGDMIKTAGGTNIAPGEVEEALVGCAGVSEAFVVGVEDEEVGGEVVAAAVIPVPGANLDEDQLRRELRTLVAAYKVPKVVWVTEKDALPFSDTGKINRRELAALISKTRDKKA